MRLRTRPAEPLTFQEAALGLIESKRAGWRNAEQVAQWAPTHQNYVYPQLASLDVKTVAGGGEGALLTVTLALAVRPDWPPTLETMAACHATAGKWEDAKRYIQAMIEAKASSSVSLAALRDRIPQWRDQVSDLLRKAGWAEQSNV